MIYFANTRSSMLGRVSVDANKFVAKREGNRAPGKTVASGESHTKKFRIVTDWFLAGQTVTTGERAPIKHVLRIEFISTCGR